MLVNRMGNWVYADKLKYLQKCCKPAVITQLTNRLTASDYISFSDAVDRVTRCLPVHDGHTNAMHLVSIRCEAVVESHMDIFLEKDPIEVCLRLYRCCWGPDAKPEHRTIWFCKGIYETQMYVQEHNEEQTTSIIFVKDLNETMLMVLDGIVAVLALLHDPEIMYPLSSEQRACIIRTYKFLYPNTSTSLSILNYMRQDKTYQVLKQASFERTHLTQFKELKKGLRAELRKYRWQTMVIASK